MKKRIIAAEDTVNAATLINISPGDLGVLSGKKYE